MTKQEKSIVDNYNYYYGRQIEDCYTKMSAAKSSSWAHIKNEMIVNGGYGLTVISHNTFMYTCAYTMPKDGGEVLVYHSPTTKKTIII